MAEIVRYVDTDIVVGGDGTSWATAYKTLSAWNAAEYKDLTAAEEHHTVYVRGVAADTTVVNMAGWTNATVNYHVHIICVDCHLGKYSTTKYRLAPTTAYTNALSGVPAYTYIVGLQFSEVGAGSNCLNVTTDYVVVSRCLFNDPDNYCVHFAGDNWSVRNCGFFGGVRGVSMTTAANGGSVVNCSFVNQSAYGIYIYTYGSFSATNCYVGNAGTACFATISGGTLTNCYSSDGTMSTTVAACATDSGAYFVNVSAGSEDLHIKAGSSLIDTGADASALMDPDEDVDGEARPSGVAWDVGYDEYVAAVTVKPTWYYEQMRKAG
jgi:hypothetical protein